MIRQSPIFGDNLPQKPLWSFETSIRWSDMDALGHVNNSIYFRYFEMARMQWWDSLGDGALGTEAIAMVVADGHCEYIVPLKYPATVTIAMSGGAAGRTSFNSYYSVTQDNGTLCARGAARIVWFDNNKDASTPLPAAVIALLPTS